MGEPVTDPAASEPQEQPDTPDQEQPAAEPEHDFQQEDQNAVHDGDVVTVQKAGPDEVDPAGQPAAEGGEFATPESAGYAETRDTAEESERGAQDLGSGDDPTQAHQPVGATANETPTLPAGAATAAAKAHAVLGHVIAVAQQAQADIGRYVPPDLLAAAEREVAAMVRSAL